MTWLVSALYVAAAIIWTIVGYSLYSQNIVSETEDKDDKQ